MMISSKAGVCTVLFLLTAQHGVISANAAGAKQSASSRTRLQGAAAVLRQIRSAGDGESGPGGEKKDQVARFRQDLIDYRKKAGTLSPEDAAQKWLTFADRFATLTYKSPEYVEQYLPISFQEVVAALPPPTSWAAISRIVTARAPLKTGKSVHDMTLLLLAHALVGNTAAMQQDEKALRARLAKEKNLQNKEKLLLNLKRSLAILTDTSRAACVGEDGQ